MSTQQASTKQVSMNIGGMGCSGCADTIQEALEAEEGVVEATVDLESDTASVTYNPNAVSTDDFKRAVEDAGYKFKGIG
jgi:copper chaperone CopZ